MLARYSKENAPVIFSLLIQTAPGFPIDVQDRDGNTGVLFSLLLVYVCMYVCMHTLYVLFLLYSYEVCDVVYNMVWFSLKDCCCI